MSGSPWLWLLAGPNGAGKSTYARNLLANVEEIVDPMSWLISFPKMPRKVLRFRQAA